MQQFKCHNNVLDYKNNLQLVGQWNMAKNHTLFYGQLSSDLFIIHTMSMTLIYNGNQVKSFEECLNSIEAQCSVLRLIKVSRNFEELNPQSLA